VLSGSRRRQRSAPEPERRREQIADAALAVLGKEGSRGLTHRAVDEAAGLPAGSTSNHFRTREALLEAAARRHAELDLPPGADVETIAETEVALDRDQARALILGALDRILEPAERGRLTARYELALESTRRPSLHEVMDDSRQRFAALAELLLRASGCQDPESHAPQLLTLLDGITVDQLQATTPTLDHPGIEALIDRFLTTC
jgi:DNA-binding transcriptional regulator YbjK